MQDKESSNPLRSAYIETNPSAMVQKKSVLAAEIYGIFGSRNVHRYSSMYRRIVLLYLLALHILNY